MKQDFPGISLTVIPWSWIAFIVALFAIGFALSGCATFDYDWKQTRLPAPAPWTTIIVADADAVCRGLGANAETGGRIIACATWSEQGCTIYLPPRAPQDIVFHERKHCLGFTH